MAEPPSARLVGMISKSPVFDLLSAYHAQDEAEAADVLRILRLVESGTDPWHRAIPLHLTASALIVHPDTGRVLLRWHDRIQAWLQIGGHGDPGEVDPVAIALREGREETGLTDLRPWPDRGAAQDSALAFDGALVHVAIVPVPANAVEPGHEHADLRFVLATDEPSVIRAENPDAPLRWLSVPEAREATLANVRITLARIAPLL
jgi:8-oxo-dGTP pyrophosphatase MutT (NUDIX family)